MVAPTGRCKKQPYIPMLFDGKTSLGEVLHKVREELKFGASLPNHPFHFFPFCTTGADARYVVLRHATSDLALWFFTDSRSSKVGQILKNSEVAAVFYHPEKRFQVRVKANAKIHHQDEVSTSCWEQVKGEAQKAYGSLVYPGHRIATPADAHHWIEKVDDRFFAVVMLEVTKLDVMQLDGLAHLRAEFVKNRDHWEMHWVAP
jgi:pyridoxamine 5'-phosphate oxidase